jgi:two-component system, OmpR family, alkaline phosphatase synthesis response regulator PhoP
MHEKILVVDDDPSIVNLLASNLEEIGYLVIKGYDGQAAITMARSERPNLIVLDVNMPMTNGLKATETIRQNEITKAIPIILLTGETSDRVFPVVQGAGRTVHIKKPVDLEELNSLIKQTLQNYPSR